MSFTIGDRVRPSGHQTQRARDYWLSCGREPMKSGAKRELDRLIAQRGTVIGILPNGVAVTCDDGSIHKSMSHMWERVDSRSMGVIEAEDGERFEQQ